MGEAVRENRAAVLEGVSVKLSVAGVVVPMENWLPGTLAAVHVTSTSPSWPRRLTLNTTLPLTTAAGVSVSVCVREKNCAM